MTADDLRDWLRLSTTYDPLRVSLLDAVDELEHVRDGLLLRAMRALDYGPPENRHPLNTIKHRRAMELHDELLELWRAGELGE